MKKKFDFKSQRASVTLYVLVVMLFFMFFSVGSYVEFSNKNQAEEKYIEQVEKEYNIENPELDMIYDETIAEEEIDISIVFNANGGVYNIAPGGQVPIQTTVTVSTQDGEDKIKSKSYAWGNSNQVRPTSWTSFLNNEQVIQKTSTNGNYYLWIKVVDNNDKETYECSSSFTVKENPIKLKDNSGGKWVKDNVIVTIDYSNTYVKNKKVGFGITYDEAVKNMQANEQTSIEISQNGYLVVTAEDAYGNSDTEYIIIRNIDKLPPTIVLTPDGGETIIRTTTSNIIVAIDVIDKMSGVKEIQYAWSESKDQEPEKGKFSNVINGNSVISPPYGEGTYYLWVKAYDNVTNETTYISKPYVLRPPLPPTVVLKEKDANGEIYQGDVWTNQDIYHDVTVAETEGNVDKYQYSSDKSIWQDIEETEDIIEYTKDKNTITYKYVNEVDATFYIKAIYEDKQDSGITETKLKIDKTAPKINSLTSEIISANKAKIIVTDIVETASGVKGYYISTSKETPTLESNWEKYEGEGFEVNNLEQNTTYYIWMLDNAGNISEVKEIKTQKANYSVDNNIYVETLKDALENAENNSNIKLLNDYTDSSTVTVDKNVSIDTQSYKLTRTEKIEIDGKNKEISLEINGNIETSSDINLIETTGRVVLSGTATIESKTNNPNYETVYNTGNLVQNGTLKIKGYYKAIENRQIYTLNAGTVEATGNVNSSYAIYNYSDGNIINIEGGEVIGYIGVYNNNNSSLNINSGKIEGTGNYGVYMTSGTLNMKDGEIIGKTDAIYISQAGTVNIETGYVKGTNGIQVRDASAIVNILSGTVAGDTYGIYGYTTSTDKGNITIGDKSKIVNKTSPVIVGGVYGVYMKENTYIYNFYNGVIMSPNKITHTEIVNPRQGYIVYTYYDETNSGKYCSVLTKIDGKIEITHTPQNWTNKDVDVQVIYPIIEGTILQFSSDGQDWENVETGNQYNGKIPENTTVYARIVDVTGNVLMSEEHEITNIDKIKPEVQVIPEINKHVIN